MLQTGLEIVQVVLALLLITLILLQQKGAGLGAAFGGASAIYTTRRGVDKIVFHATIVISILFFGISLLMAVL